MKKKFFSFTLRFILFYCLVFCSFADLYAQSFTVTGKVTDNTGVGLEGTSVKVKGTSKGTTSNVDGLFSISGIAKNNILVFSRVGFDKIEIAAGVNNVINVSLVRASDSLTEVIVMGYTQQTRARTTAAIAKLNPDELKNATNPNPVQALQGKIAGVSIPIQSGQPGAGANSIVIRGSTKLNPYGSGQGNSGGNPYGSISGNSGPLVIIDGVIRPMDDINPENIESLSVMKDAASTSIYGARGANGVIVIKTKGGKFNSKMNVSINHRTTSETQASGYDYMTAEQYLSLARITAKNTADPIDKNNLLNNGGFSAGTKLFTAKGQYGNYVYSTALYDNILAIEGQPYIDNLLAKGWKVMDDPINPGTRLLFADNHYQDQIWKTGISQNDNISITGGSEKATYNVGFGINDQKGVLVGTGYKRFDMLGNFSFKASENFKIDVMINYQNLNPNYVDAFQNDLIRAVHLTPLIRIFKDDGNPATGENYSTRNRLHTLKYDEIRVVSERLVSRVGGDLTILKGLHFKPSFSYLIDDYSYMFRRLQTPQSEIQQPGTQRQKNEQTNASRQRMTDQILQYDFSIGTDHNFTTLAGFNYQQNNNNVINIGSQRATNDYIFTINEPSTTVINGTVLSNVTNFGTSLLETKSASYFGQFNYDYNAKYLLSGSIRRDGFSNFTDANKYAFFPSIAAGWNIHKEKFWNVSFINALKFRGSWGTSGLSDLSITDTYGGYGAVVYANGSGILRSNLQNPNLKWETTETADLAFDASFFRGKINLTVDYYNKLTRDRIASKPLPSESPFSSITFNNGTLQNKGVEIELGATIINVKSFIWKTNFSFAFNKTTIIKLPENGRLQNRQGGDKVYDPGSKQLIEAGGFAEGETPYGLWAYKVLGVFSTDAEAATWNLTHKDLLASPVGITLGKRAGDFIFDDINNDGVINSQDQVFMGYKSPNKIGGMQNTFTYKGISVRFTMDYAMGHIISDGALARSLGQGRAFNEGAVIEAIGSNTWQKSGDVNKQYARFSFADFDFGQRNYIRSATNGNNNAYGPDVSAMITKGDFLAFRELSIAYDIPQSIVRKIHCTGFNVFAGIYNLGYLTKYKGVNPETYTGFDQGSYPRPRQFSLGGTLKF